MILALQVGQVCAMREIVVDFSVEMCHNICTSINLFVGGGRRSLRLWKGGSGRRCLFVRKSCAKQLLDGFVGTYPGGLSRLDSFNDFGVFTLSDAYGILGIHFFIVSAFYIGAGARLPLRLL